VRIITITALSTVYIFISMIGLTEGINDSIYKGKLECTKNKQYRIVKLFPSYAIGCWLGEREEVL
tara:strand:+ start:887 stop:1081 length:195 start_codon:yes stop_codon:yes gene_type:complete